MLVTITAITRAIVTITIVDPKNIPATVADEKKSARIEMRHTKQAATAAPGRT